MPLNRNTTLTLVFIILAAVVLTLVAYPYGIIHAGVFGTVEMFLIFLLILLFLILLAAIVETGKKLQDQSSAMSRFKDIIQGSRSMGFIWRIKPGQWPVEFVTENVEQLTGYTAEDFMSGRVSWPGIIHPEDMPRLEKEVSEYLNKGVESWSQEYRLITKSGEIKWFCDGNQVITDKKGHPSKIQAIVHDITVRKRLEERLTKVNECLLNLGPDFHENISRITALCGELFAGTCAMYNRLADNMLYTIGPWHAPPDFKPLDKPDGHICYDVIQGVPQEELLVVPDLLATRYAETDSNVRRYGLRSYMGHAVHCGRDKVGALCVVFQHRFLPTENDRKLFGILASAISVEESRHAAEQTLRESEHNLAMTFNSIGDAVIATDIQGSVVRMNRVAERLTGWPLEKAKGRPLAEVFHIINQHTRCRVENPVARVLETGKVQELASDTVLVSRQGAEFVIADSAAAIANNAMGQTYGTVLVFRDTTEEHATREALRASEENYQTLFEDTVFGIIAADSETRKFVYVNKSICRMLGYSPEELLPLGVENIHPKDSMDKVITGFEAQTRGERVLVTIPCLRKDGTLFYADVFAGSMVLNRRKCTVGFFVDVTDRLRAEQKIQEAQHKSAVLSEAIENAHHGCLIISEDYKVVFSNPYALAKLGFEASELKRLDWFSLCADREQAENAMKTITITRRWAGEAVITQKDGGQFPALVSITAMETEGQKIGLDGYIALFQDISTHKELQSKLLTSEKLAVMGRLVADVAHEINNPLAIIIGGTQLILSRLDDTQPSLKNQLETVLRNARRCKTILSSLLSYGRTLGRKEEAIHLPSLIQEAINDVNYQYDMSGIETELNCEGADDMEITGNRSALLSVFINLIRNARQAMGEKGCLTITSKEQKGNLIRVDIHDTGVGMSKKQIAKLFTPFISGWKDEEGSGLGLATSLGIVETHGGHMTAESEGEGKGATFAILLPCKMKGKPRE